ncbi:hypothetical protein STEG23_014647, partial [Scotinomys teguina]
VSSPIEEQQSLVHSVEAGPSPSPLHQSGCSGNFNTLLYKKTNKQEFLIWKMMAVLSSQHSSDHQPRVQCSCNDVEDMLNLDFLYNCLSGEGLCVSACLSHDLLHDTGVLLTCYRYENLIFDKDAKTVKWKKESIFNKWCWHNWMATCRRLQIDPYLSPCTKLKSKWIKDLNINPVTLNLIEEKVGSTLERIGTGDHFLNITPIAQTLSATINQWDYMKLRSFCKAKDTITKTKRQPTEWEKIFTNPTSDRGLISRIYKELKKHDIKTSNSPVEKWAIELNREFTAEEYRMAERHLRKCSTSLLIREMQIKTTLRYHLTPDRMAKIKTPRTVHVGEDVEQEEHSSTFGGNADWYNHSGKQYGKFSENWESFFLQTQPYHSWAYTQRMPSHTTRTHAQLCS